MGLGFRKMKKNKTLQQIWEKKKPWNTKHTKETYLLGRYKLPSFFVTCKTKEARISTKFLVENSFFERLTIKVVKTNVTWSFCITHHVGVCFNALIMSIRIDTKKIFSLKLPSL
jgi:hypothetical protein